MNLNFGQLISIARSGGNPMGMFQQMAQGNPQMMQAMQYIQGKSPQQLQEIAMNMAKERGTTVEQVARQLGLF